MKFETLVWFYQHRGEHGKKLSHLFGVLGMKKQSFYQKLNRKKDYQDQLEQLFVVIVLVRQNHPRMSARDIYHILKPDFIGRDNFERFCMERGLRIGQLRNYRVTTNSLGVTRFPNLIKDFKCTGVNQVFVSDITYFELGLDTYYLTFIMDLFNREIVGWAASDNLRTESTTLAALRMAIKVRGKDNFKNAILHSDGGGQYYDNGFKDLTKELGIKNSMTESKVFENTHAERLNGIIKNNYLYPYGPKDFASLKRMLRKAVLMYNTEKPHSALGKLTPAMCRTVDNENNSASYCPLSTVYHHYQN